MFDMQPVLRFQIAGALFRAVGMHKAGSPENYGEGNQNHKCFAGILRWIVSRLSLLWSPIVASCWKNIFRLGGRTGKHARHQRRTTRCRTSRTFHSRRNGSC